MLAYSKYSDESVVVLQHEFAVLVEQTLAIVYVRRVISFCDVWLNDDQDLF